MKLFQNYFSNTINLFLGTFLLIGFNSCEEDLDKSRKEKEKNPLILERRLDELLVQMTIEEKVRQLDMYNGSELTSNNSLDSQKARSIVGDIGIGSVHDFYPSTAKDANDVQRFIIEHSRLGIPAIFIEEGLHGYQGSKATTFPVPIGVASTWNPDLAFKMGRVVASEARAKNVHMLLAPVLGISREPRWGRTEETFGEDTYLASKIGVSVVRGLQGNSLSDNNAVVSEPKHYGVHSAPAGGRNTASVFVGEREARTSFLPVFEMAVKEGNAQGIMAAYHELDGVPCSSSKWLLSEVLRGEWGFDGFVLSDLGAINRLNSTFHVAKNDKEAIIQALEAGMDMQFYDFPNDVFQNSIIEAVTDGEMDTKVLDRAVRNVLRVKFRLGLFDNPYIDEQLEEKVYHSEDNQKLAKEVGSESIILLKNDENILPLSKDKVKSIAVLGDLSNVSLLGGYSPKNIEAVTVLEGIRKKVGEHVEIKHSKGISVTKYLTDISGDNLYVDKEKKGVRVEYFNNLKLEGTADVVRVEDDFIMNWHNLSPAPGIDDFFSARLTAFIKPDIDGRYKIQVGTSNNFRYYVDDELVYDSWEKNAKRNNGIILDLKAGQYYAIKIEFSKTEFFARLGVNWSIVEEAASAKNNILKQAKSYAETSDVAIVVLGENAAEVGEGKGKMNLDLEPAERELLEAVHSTGTPVILVLMNGRPLTINWSVENVSAILETWYAGEFSGDAIADVLFGDYNPSGRLPITFPKSVGQLPMFYNHKPSFSAAYVDGDAKPLFPFGYGMSYTTFQYSNLKLSKSEITQNEFVKVSVDIKNTGKMEGADVVQLYINDIVSSLVTPVIELKGFKKVYLQPNETRNIEFVLTPDEFSLWNIEMERVVEPGAFSIMIGHSCENIALTDTLHVIEY